MTDELGLRIPLADDWVRVHEWGTRPEVYRYQTWGPNTEQRSQEFVSEMVQTWAVADAQRVRWSWMAERLGDVLNPCIRVGQPLILDVARPLVIRQ